MRRYAYPYGRYLIKDKKIEVFGGELKKFVEELGFPIIKYDTKNEENGILIIAVNKRVKELMRQKKPPGHLQMVLRELPFDMPSFREIDKNSQRVGIELYLWQIDEGTVLEIFVLPYMEHFNKKEIFGITETKKEQITDWVLCQQTWDYLEEKINEKLGIKPIQCIA